MQKISAIYQRWTPKERQAFKSWLGLFRKRGSSTKQVELLKLMDKQPEIGLAEASTKLYGNAKSKAFLMLKRRLYERMADFMCGGLFQADREVDAEMPYMGQLMEFRKAMAVATVLTEKRLSHLAVEFLEKGLELAQNCAAPELELDCLIRLRGLHHFHSKGFAGLNADVMDALGRAELDAEALAVYHGFFEGMAMKSGDNAAKVTHLEEHVPSLRDKAEQVESIRAAYYLYLLEANLARFKGKLEMGRKLAMKALEILDDHPGLRSRQRLADVHVQLGQIILSNRKFGDSISHFLRARPYMKPNSMGFTFVSLLLSYGLLLDGRISEAEEELQHIENGLKKENGRPDTEIFELFVYLNSCLAWFKEDFQLAFQRWNQIEGLNSDKSGWQSGLRLYEILLLVELGELDVVEYRLESLRKHLDRYGRASREGVLHALLHGQGRRFFDFGVVEGENELLAQLENEFPWDPLGHEVVRIDAWYRDRAAEARGDGG